MSMLYFRPFDFAKDAPGHTYRNDGAVKDLEAHTLELYLKTEGKLDGYNEFRRSADYYADGRYLGLRKDGILHHTTFYKEADPLNSTFRDGHEIGHVLIEINAMEELFKRDRLIIFRPPRDCRAPDEYHANYCGFHAVDLAGWDVMTIDPRDCNYPEQKSALKAYCKALKLREWNDKLAQFNLRVSNNARQALKGSKTLIHNALHYRPF